MQKSVTANTDINEGRLDGRLDIDNPALVDIAQVFLFRCTLVIELVQPAILKNPNTDLLRLDRIDQDLPDNGRLLSLRSLPGLGLLPRRRFLSRAFRFLASAPAPAPAPTPASAGWCGWRASRARPTRGVRRWYPPCRATPPHTKACRTSLNSHPDVVQEMAQRIRHWRALHPISGTRSALAPPPGWRAPRDWATYPRPVEDLQESAAPGMAPTEMIERILDMQHGERGRLVYDCVTRWYLAGLCTKNE